MHMGLATTNGMRVDSVITVTFLFYFFNINGFQSFIVIYRQHCRLGSVVEQAASSELDSCDIGTGCKSHWHRFLNVSFKNTL